VHVVSTAAFLRCYYPAARSGVSRREKTTSHMGGLIDISGGGERLRELTVFRPLFFFLPLVFPSHPHHNNLILPSILCQAVEWCARAVPLQQARCPAA
jgi:hypothetical protein